jgi:quinol monooxygenase YgiN
VTESPIILNVIFEAASGREEELSAALSALVEASRTEPGCLAYELNSSTEKPGTFLFYEKFADQAALDEHIASPYFQKFVKQREANDPVAKVTVTRWATLK